MWIVAGHAVGRSLCGVCWGTPNGLSLQVMAAMVPRAVGGQAGAEGGVGRKSRGWSLLFLYLCSICIC